ncbi:hypothetical protein EON80_05100, partial [bacterium]
RATANAQNATLRFLPMQPGPDKEILQGLTTAGEILSLASSFEVMIAMRLHALIFAASAGVPVVALNYDPKVASLATLLGAPLLQTPAVSDLAALPALVAGAKAASPTVLEEFRAKARRNAELAVGLANRS